MPFQSTMNADEKNRVKSVLSANNKILMATVARIYYAHPDPNSWTFSGEQGGLAFVKDKNNGLYYFRLVDLQGTRGVLWEHELYEGLVLNEDRPFFHSFAGDDCMIGLVYTDESEASSFMKVVTKKRSALGKAKAAAAKRKSSKNTNTSKSGGIDKSLISGPQVGSFRHISHMGYDPDKGFTSDNVDPSWMAFLAQLQNHGVDADLIQENMGFIKDFVRDAQAPKSKKSATSGNGTSGEKKKKAEKPAVPSTPTASKSAKKAPAPPVPRRGHGQSDSVASVSTPVAEPAPQPPKPAAAPPAPPPPPSRVAPVAAPSASVPPPPPPPPAPAARPSVPAPPVRPNGAPAAAPPPPPPPPSQTPVASPPPPPPPPPPAIAAASGIPPPPPPPAPAAPAPPIASATSGSGGGRSALLESIQGKGIHSLRKTEGTRESTVPGLGRVSGEPSPAPRSPPAEETSGSASGGGGDLAAALAAALTQRNKKLGDSDDEDDDEDEWD